MKKYKVRPNSIADHAIRIAPVAGVVLMMVLAAMCAGLMTSFEIGVL